jgi:hypothetical protein
MLYFRSSGTYGSQLSTFQPGRSALLEISLARRCIVIFDAVVAAHATSKVEQHGNQAWMGITRKKCSDDTVHPCVHVMASCQ